jgi:hypothetical protein
MAMSPTARSLAECRKRGWIAGVVEQTIPHTFIKRDFIGIIDIIALTGTGILGIQATSGANHAARMTKAKAEPKLAKWLADGGRFAVWSFAKQGERGKRKTWKLREDEYVIGMPKAGIVYGSSLWTAGVLIGDAVEYVFGEPIKLEASNG